MSDFHDDTDAEKPRRKWVDREGILQTQIFRMVKVVIDLPPNEWLFFSYNRGQATSANDYARQAARGMQKGTLDTSIKAKHMIPFSMELKAPGKKPDPKKDAAQIAMIEWLVSIGEYAGWANSCASYVNHLRGARFPLRPGATVTAMQYDAKVEANILAAVARQEAGSRKPSAPRKGRAAPRNDWTRAAKRTGILF